MWRPDQDLEGIVGWLRSRHKKRFGFLLMSIGFVLQLVGLFVPVSRYVMYLSSHAAPTRCRWRSSPGGESMNDSRIVVRPVLLMS